MRSPERALWTIVAVSLFLPMFQSNWLGNISTLVALGVTLTAFGGVIAGGVVAVGLLVKLTPGAFAPAAFFAGRSSRLSLVGTLAVLGGLLFVLAPDAWLDYPAVLRNLVAGSGDVHWNLAPAVVAEQAGLGAGVVGIIRVGAIVVAGVALVLSVWLARMPGGMPAATVAGTVTMLLLPGTLWYHYLAVLLPLAVMAWPRAGSRVRVAIVIAIAAVSAAGLILDTTRDPRGDLRRAGRERLGAGGRGRALGARRVWLCWRTMNEEQDPDPASPPPEAEHDDGWRTSLAVPVLIVAVAAGLIGAMVWVSRGQQDAGRDALAATAVDAAALPVTVPYRESASDRCRFRRCLDRREHRRWSLLLWGESHRLSSPPSER